MSAIITAIIRVFFPPEMDKFNFARTGVNIAHQGSHFNVRGDLAHWVADEKALKDEGAEQYERIWV